jgi:hypothetical protein
MDIKKLVPIDFSRNITPPAAGDWIWNDYLKVQFLLTESAASLISGGDENPALYVVSFADRPNTGTQPVGDDVVVDTYWDDGDDRECCQSANGHEWSLSDPTFDEHIAHWKPNHAAMLKQWQAEQLLPQPVGDGIHDDTESLQAHLDAGRGIPQGSKGNSFVTSKPLDVSGLGDEPSAAFPFDKPTFTQSMKDSGSRLTIGMHYLDDSGDRCEYVGISSSSIIGRYVDMNNVRSDHLSISDGDLIKPIQTAEERLTSNFENAIHDAIGTHDQEGWSAIEDIAAELMGKFTITLKG